MPLIDSEIADRDRGRGETLGELRQALRMVGAVIAVSESLNCAAFRVVMEAMLGEIKSLLPTVGGK